MAGEENNTGAETVPLKVDDVAQESVPDREKQAIVSETASLKDDLASDEGDDVAAEDSSSVKVIRKYGRRKKKPGRKSKAEIEKEKTEEAFENGTKEETSKGDDDMAAGNSISVHATPAKKRGRNTKTEKENKTGEGADVVGGFSSVGVRKSERPRKIKSLNEDYLSDLDEAVKKKGKRGRKKKVIIGVSDESDEAEHKGENVKTEKKKPGRKRKEISSSGDENEAEKEGVNVKKEEKKKPGRKKKVSHNSSEENDEDEQDGENGRTVKIEENELTSEKNLESSVLSDDIKGYSLRTAKKIKPECIEQHHTVAKFNKRNSKVTSKYLC
jgi:hypothetical protein